MKFRGWLTYGRVFFLVAIGYFAVSVTTSRISKGLAIFLIYCAVSFALVSLAYALVWPKALGKRPSGQFTLWSWAPFAPYFVMSHLSFRLYLATTREPPYAAVAPNVLLGRRLLRHERPPAGVIGSLDLAAEFPEMVSLRRLDRYRSLPILDGLAPTDEELRSAVTWIAETAATGAVYVHCPLGHARSACVVIAYLLSEGIVHDVDQGVWLPQMSRSGVRLQPCQLERLRAFEPASTRDASP